MKVFSTLNIVERIWKKLEPMVDQLKKDCPSELKDEFEQHLKEFTIIRKKVNRLFIARVICYILLYISLFSLIFGNIAFVKEIINWIALFSGILGSSLLFIAIILLTQLINAYLNDAHLHADFIIAVYVRSVQSKPKEKKGK
ncbi:hypothetical protein HYW21_01000 [Candidatus Woesearchaeota archaeon]|nr:hypothetical protein [Candidatus Woesearchaeota archaeon]